jgi:hypothetical protein
MKCVVIAMLGAVLAIGCSGSTGDDDDDTGDSGDSDGGDSNDNAPPTLEVTTPERGTLTDSGTVVVSGRATDAETKIEEVTVNGTAAQLRSDGTFETSILVGDGITLIETVARDAGGNETTDARGVLAGTLVDQSTAVTEGVVANLSSQAMEGLGVVINDFANGLNLTDLARSFNPVANTGGTSCNSASVFIDSIQRGPIEVDVASAAGGIRANVVIRDLVANGHATFRALCATASINFTITADSYNLSAVIAPTLNGGSINIAVNDVGSTFSGFNVNLPAVPGFVESLIRGPVRDFIANLLRDQITGRVPGLATTFLGDFLAATRQISLLGQTINLTIAPSSMNWTEQGGTIVLDTSTTVDGVEGLYLSTPRPRPSDADLASTGIRVALADDVLNQLLASVWSSGALEDTILPLPGDALSAAFGGDVESAALTMILPPVANFDTTTGTARITIADLQLEAFSPSGTSLAAFVLSAEIDLAAETSSDGKVRLITSAPRILAQVLSQSDSLLTELTAEKIEAIAELGVTQISGFADDLLDNLPVPGLSGATITSPTLQPSSGYMLLGGDLSF